MRDESKKKNLTHLAQFFLLHASVSYPWANFTLHPSAQQTLSDHDSWSSLALFSFFGNMPMSIYIFFFPLGHLDPRHSFLPDGRCHRRWQFKGALCVPTRAAWVIALWSDVAWRYSTNICWYSPQNASASDMAVIYGSNVSWKRFWSQKCKNKL